METLEMSDLLVEWDIFEGEEDYHMAEDCYDSDDANSESDEEIAPENDSLALSIVNEVCTDYNRHLKTPFKFFM